MYGDAALRNVDDSRLTTYLTRLYGTRSLLAAPNIDLGLVYRPESLGITLAAVPSNHRLRLCPKNTSVAYADFNVHAPLMHDDGEYVAWYPRPRNAASVPLQNNSWAEVTHCSGSKFETAGAWHYVVKGSGIWINTGRTIVFTTH